LTTAPAWRDRILSDNDQSTGPTKRARHLAVTSTCGLICLVAATVLGVAQTFDGVYGGSRSLTKGPAYLCSTDDNRLSVTIHAGTLEFTDGDYDHLVIAFTPKPDGSFQQTYNEGDGEVTIRGSIVGSVIDADVTDSFCEHRWHLNKQ